MLTPGRCFGATFECVTPHSIGFDTASTARLIAGRSRKVDMMNAPMCLKPAILGGTEIQVAKGNNKQKMREAIRIGAE